MLKISALCKSYKNKSVLQNLDLCINDHDIVALIGINGAGKSTMLEIICGLVKKDSGLVEINDISIDDKKQKNNLKAILGYMPQFFSMFNDLTVKENLLYLCAVYHLKSSRCEEILQLCNLKEKQNQLAKNLSGGYKQLLSLAGTILHSPKLLILDEPTSAMDPLFRMMFWKIIKNLNKDGTTILVTTHYVEEIAECNKLFCLSQGRILIECETESLNLKQDTTKFKSIFDMYLQKE